MITLALGAADVRHMEFWGNYLFRNYMVTEDGNVQWTAKRTRQMLADYRNLAEQGYINPAYRNVSDSQTAQSLASGQAAMVYAGPWMLTRIEDLNPQIHLGFFFLPGKDGITYAVQERRAEWGYPRPLPGTRTRWKQQDVSLSFIIQKEFMKMYWKP